VESLKETSNWASEEVRQLRGAISNGGKTGDLLTDDTHAGAPLPAATTRGSVAAALPLATAPRRPPADAPLHRRVLREISDDDVLGQGAKVAFYMFSSLPPALLVVFALTGLF